MFNKQLKQNITALDVHISNLSEEISKLQQDDRYEVTMGKLEALTELRVKLSESLKENETSASVMEMDDQIEDLVLEIKHLQRNEVHASKLKKLEELTKIRGELAESKVKESYAPHIISGVVGLTTMLMVIRHEELNVITTKALGIATRFIRGQ